MESFLSTGRRCLAVALAFAWLASSPLSATTFKIYVEEGGVYQVTFEGLRAAGLAADGLASAGLGLTCAGEDVPIYVDDGGDGVFGPGDRFELVGERLRGEVSYYSENSRYNVYVLSDGRSDPARMTQDPHPEAGRGRLATYRDERHLEEDHLLLRLRPAKDGRVEELWYWAKLVMDAEEPFVRTIHLPDLDRRGAPVHLRIALRGWSRLRVKPDPEMSDHRVDVALNGEPLASASWNGDRPYLLEVPAVPARRLVRGDNVLELRVPGRRPAAGGDLMIDVVMLNWIEIDSPRDRRLEGQASLRLVAPAPRARLRDAGGRELVAYGREGSRTVVPKTSRRKRTFVPPAGETSFVVAAPEDLLTPAAVVLDRPSHLADPGNRADYVMIAHRTLLDAVRPLAELHRSRGLAVEVVDLQDVYDEFHDGIPHPRAIRDFLRYAYETWQRPAPRYVLLVGDASWDARNARAQNQNYADWTYRPGESVAFIKNETIPYATSAGLNLRGLVPTWNHATYQGHAASDNYFVAVSGDDLLPDMAIGRLPVVEPAELARIVEKIRRYITAPGVGPWRHRGLFVTNEERRYQRQSDALARRLSNRGFAPLKVYPESDEASNEGHSEHLVEAFDEGQLFVHFLGHGGRYIWRTGPSDLEKNHDLFTLEHLDRLKGGAPLPVVLSLTCYSAPFDHPSADSIGEKLLRLDDRGAIAVVAASWRNNPSPLWSELLLEELTRPGATIGEAVLLAKRRAQNKIFTTTYNLLGDPAVPVDLPGAAVDVHATAAPTGALRVEGTVGVQGFAGQLLVEAVDAAGDDLASVTRDVEAPGFAVELDLGSVDPAAVQVVRVYAWNSARNVDAAGAVELVAAPTRKASHSSRTADDSP